MIVPVSLTPLVGRFLLGASRLVNALVEKIKKRVVMIKRRKVCVAGTGQLLVKDGRLTSWCRLLDGRAIMASHS